MVIQLVSGKPGPPIHSQILGPPRLVPLLGLVFPLGGPSREASLQSSSPGSRLVGSPCRPETTRAAWLSAQPCPPPHTPQMQQPPVTTRGGGDNKQERPQSRNPKSIRKCAEVGGQLEGVGGEVGSACWSLLWKGRDRQIFKRQVGPPFVPLPCQSQSIQASASQDARGAWKGPGSQSSSTL